MNKKKIFLITFSFLVVIVSLITINGCKTSRVEPEIPTPNPPAPTQQALILAGYVRDVSNNSGISGAAVKISGAALLTTLLSDVDGKFSYDASNVSDNSLNITAFKDGYAYGNRTATINKAANSASVADILLTKLQTTSTTVTVASGGYAAAANTQSVSNQPLTVQVPPNAVSSNVQLTVSSIPAGQVPRAATANTSILTAGQFGPSGTVFNQDVTITFPLPYQRTAGTTFALMQLNDGTYTNSGFTARVNADGTSASAQVRHFSIYTLQEGVSVSMGTPTTSNGPESSVALSSGSTTRQFIITNSISLSGSGIMNETWLIDQIAGLSAFSIGSSTQILSFNTPALPRSYVQNGVQVGPSGHQTEKGNWEYRWFYALQSRTTNGNASGPNWSRSITTISQLWVITNQGWYWISHDQGGVAFGPY